MPQFFTVFVCLLLGSSTVWAATEPATPADSSSTTKLEDLKPRKKFEVDKRLTDLELRAAAGSMSRWSVKAELGYTGPAVNSLHEYNRPNPNNSSADMRVNLSGAIGIRYRLSEQDTLSFGTGVTWYTPLEAVQGKEVKKVPGAADDFSTSSPRLGYDHSYIAGGIQMRDAFSARWITDSFYMKTGQVATLGFTHAMKKVIGTSRLTVGFDISPSLYIYEREWIPKDRRTSNVFIGTYPNISYRLLSNLDFTNSLSYSWKNLRQVNNWAKWKMDLITCRTGIGWSITPEIYLNPYISWFTQTPEMQTTTFALGTVFSVF